MDHYIMQFLLQLLGLDSRHPQAFDELAPLIIFPTDPGALTLPARTVIRLSAQPGPGVRQYILELRAENVPQREKCSRQ